MRLILTTCIHTDTAGTRDLLVTDGLTFARWCVLILDFHPGWAEIKGYVYSRLMRKSCPSTINPGRVEIVSAKHNRAVSATILRRSYRSDRIQIQFVIIGERPRRKFYNGKLFLIVLKVSFQLVQLMGDVIGFGYYFEIIK